LHPAILGIQSTPYVGTAAGALEAIDS
jgi:hypothetical protein